MGQRDIYIKHEKMNPNNDTIDDAKIVCNEYKELKFIMNDEIGINLKQKNIDPKMDEFANRLIQRFKSLSPIEDPQSISFAGSFESMKALFVNISMSFINAQIINTCKTKSED